MEAIDSGFGAKEMCLELMASQKKIEFVSGLAVYSQEIDDPQLCNKLEQAVIKVAQRFFEDLMTSDAQYSDAVKKLLLCCGETIFAAVNLVALVSAGTDKICQTFTIGVDALKTKNIAIFESLVSQLTDLTEQDWQKIQDVFAKHSQPFPADVKSMAQWTVTVKV